MPKVQVQVEQAEAQSLTACPSASFGRAVDACADLATDEILDRVGAEEVMRKAEADCADLVEPRELRRAELQGRGAEAVLDLLELARADDRDVAIALGQDPRGRDLGRARGGSWRRADCWPSGAWRSRSTPR